MLQDFTVGNLITIVTYIASLAFSFGILNQKMVHLRADIARIERKQDENRQLAERMISAEYKIDDHARRIEKLESARE